MKEGTQRIGIIGGGIIGLSIGWQLQRQGYAVTIHEKDQAGCGASKVAAGMLAPLAEVGFEEIRLMELGLKSLSLYESFLEELQSDVEQVPALDKCGTLLVGVDRDDREYLQRIFNFRQRLGIEAEWLTGRGAREREPFLSPKVNAAVWLPGDAQIDNWKLLDALQEAFRKKGGELREGSEVKSVEEEREGHRVTTNEGKDHYQELVIAAGARSGVLVGESKGGNEPGIWPVKGQVAAVGLSSPVSLNTMVRSPRVYLVPKEGEHILIGATSEDRGFDQVPTAGALRELLEDAWELVPGIAELPFEGTDVGSRPGSGDNGPVLGRTKKGGVYWASGHYRHGILLTPITAYAIAGLIKGEDPGSIPEITPFLAERFQKGSESREM